MSTQIITPNSQQYVGFMDFTRIDAAFKCCEMIAKASFCPKDFRGKPEEVLCAIQYGMEIGLSPMQAIQSIAVINGKPSIYGDGLIGLCLAFPECEDIQESFDETTMMATCRVKRRGKIEVVSSYSKADAERAKLWNRKGYNGGDTPWVTYPKRMLKMRARGFALRDAFADRLKGIITAEEARDYPTREQKIANVVTPIKPSIGVVESLPLTSKPNPILLGTKNHLMFLIAKLQLNDEVKARWFSKLKISSIDELSELKAQHEIMKIEKKYPHLIEVLKCVNGVKKQYDQDKKCIIKESKNGH
jgi:hypothetical protein